jgi:hypothetical protein
MKKLKTHYAIILLITAYFLFNGCLPRKSEIVVHYGAMQFYSWELYATELQSEGYTLAASTKIAKVEFKLLPVDEDYTALIED